MAAGEPQPLRAGDEVTSGGLYRRILPHRDYFKFGDEREPSRATSLNFLPDSADDDSAVSMFRAAETSPSEVLEGHNGYGLLEIGVEVLWALGMRVVYTPQWGKGHVSVYGFTKKAQPRRDAAYASHVLIPPTRRPAQ